MLWTTAAQALQKKGNKPLAWMEFDEAVQFLGDLLSLEVTPCCLACSSWFRAVNLSARVAWQWSVLSLLLTCCQSMVMRTVQGAVMCGAILAYLALWYALLAVMLELYADLHWYQVAKEYTLMPSKPQWWLKVVQSLGLQHMFRDPMPFRKG